MRAMARIGPRSLDSHYPPKGGLVLIRNTTFCTTVLIVVAITLQYSVTFVTIALPNMYLYDNMTYTQCISSSVIFLFLDTFKSKWLN